MNTDGIATEEQTPKERQKNTAPKGRRKTQTYTEGGSCAPVVIRESTRGVVS